MAKPLVFPPYRAGGRGLFWGMIVATLLISCLPLALTASSAWGYATLRYELTPSELVIVYGGSVTRIPRQSITAVQELRPTGGVRRMGTALPGLQQGKWSFNETGPITLYATARGGEPPLTVLETAAGKWGITPQDAAGFRQALQTGQTGVWQPQRAGNAWPAMLALPVFGLVILLGVGGILLAFVPRPDRIQYELADDAVLVRGGWGPIRIPYDWIVAAEAASPQGAPWRLMGAALPGVYWGSFHWKQVGSFNLYGTRCKPLVLIRTHRATYGLTPADEAGFLQALRARISPEAPPG